MSDIWFDIVVGQDLEQGDLLLGFPYYRPLLTHPVVVGAEIPLEHVTYDSIVLSQTCDLVEGREKIDDVVLCAAPTLQQAKDTEGHILSRSDPRKNLVKYALPGFHPLKEFTSTEISRPMSVAQFSAVFTPPIGYVRGVVRSIGPRLRLRSPYREHLAQRFGYFFSRIALNDELTLPDLQ